jgi:hypothetical protein
MREEGPGSPKSHHARRVGGPCCVFIGWRASQNSADGSRPRPCAADGKLTTLSCAADRAGMQRSLPANIERDACAGTANIALDLLRSCLVSSRWIEVRVVVVPWSPGIRGFREPGRDSDRYGRFPAQARGAPARHAGSPVPHVALPVPHAALPVPYAALHHGLGPRRLRLPLARRPDVARDHRRSRARVRARHPPGGQ